MTAREMFEELGFKLIKKDLYDIIYINDDDEKINFGLLGEWIDIKCYVNKDVRKAIQTQMEELGWDNEEC